LSHAATVQSIAKAAIGPSKGAVEAAAEIAVAAEVAAVMAAAVEAAGVTATASATEACRSPEMLANSCMAAYI
jgi:hypothetical protein